MSRFSFRNNDTLVRIISANQKTATVPDGSLSSDSSAEKPKLQDSGLSGQDGGKLTGTDAVIHNYLQGILWVMDTYANGSVLDYHYYCLAMKSNWADDVDIADGDKGVPPAKRQKTEGGGPQGGKNAVDTNLKQLVLEYLQKKVEAGGL